MEKLTKMNKYEMLAAIPEVANDPILSEFVAAEMEALAKRYANRKETAKQKENTALLDVILSHMEPGTQYTITDLIKVVPECNELSNQKVSAVVRKGIDNGKVEKVMVNRQSKFMRVGD